MQPDWNPTKTARMLARGLARHYEGAGAFTHRAGRSLL